jgi:sarcosine dehydrogenase
MLQYGAVMEEKQGWERPGYFSPDESALVQNYDWYGNYGYEKNVNTSYMEKLEGDYKFGFSDHHDLVSREADNAFHVKSVC